MLGCRLGQEAIMNPDFITITATHTDTIIILIAVAIVGWIAFQGALSLARSIDGLSRQLDDILDRLPKRDRRSEYEYPGTKDD